MPKDGSKSGQIENTAGIPEEFLKPYQPQNEESAMYALWENSGYFNPDKLVEDGIVDADAEAFSIVLPPPNVTGTLHMGHAYEDSLQDAFVRIARMRGKKTLWVPGTDSAAIATQSKVEAEMYKKEKKTRYDIGREKLMKRIEVFTEESKNTIIGQVRALGASLDWSRYAYTMDKPRYKAVMTAFIRMYEAGLIYRGERIVNWDPKLQTTVSDDEIEYVEQKDPFYYFQYGPFVIGTVRPETKFGDKYVVMHPEDARYKEYAHGQTLDLEWINGPITATVIKDEAADMEVGSGVMTITPAHSGVDFEIAQRHGLDIEKVIDEKGLLLPIAGEFAGQHIKKARGAIVEKLQSKGLLVKTDDDYVHNVATNSRGGGVIEPQIKQQWFVSVEKRAKFPDGKERTLKEYMREAVEGGSVKILPSNFEKVYYHWIDNLRDWCISRQIWFGHRIPAWFNGTDVKVQLESPGEGWEQDPDTLDTWFSSGLWTLSTLGWPEQTKDLRTYYPTSLMAPGYEILFFWVARMVLMNGFLVGQVPFKTVYLHGIVRDKQGRKFSKSLGNGIDPLDLIKQYGADAVRMSLLVSAAPGNDIKYDESRVRGYKMFANKVWNIARFVLEGGDGGVINEADARLLAEARDIAAQVTKNIDEYRLDLAADTVYHYLWDRFAAEIIEESKPILKGDDQAARASRAQVLREILTMSLKMLHPFMPFVTEAIWQKLPQKDSELLMVAKWPN